jgi:hypothetical protein
MEQSSITINSNTRLHEMKNMKRKEKTLQNKTGMHPIAMTILLITILLAVAGITYIWMTIQNRAGNAIKIQSVAFQQSATKIYIQNIGQGQVNIKLVQINNDQFEINMTNCTVASQNTTTITEGSTAEITINQAYETTVHIKVITEEGAFYESDYKP